MKRLHNRGITLIELLVTVAILGNLAAVAIPQFRTFQIKAIRSEAMLTLDGIQKNEGAYFATASHYSSEVGVIGLSVGDTTKYGWSLNNLQFFPCFCGFDGNSTGFMASLTQDFDGDPTKDIFAFKTHAIFFPPGCPVNVPFQYQDDLTEQILCP